MLQSSKYFNVNIPGKLKMSTSGVIELLHNFFKPIIIKYTFSNGRDVYSKVYIPGMNMVDPEVSK